MSISNTKKIHFLLILHHSGLCVYSRIFSSKFKDTKVNLITGFISAIFKFSDEVLSRHLEILELGDLRLVLKRKQDFIFIMLTDSTENLIFINKVLAEIIKAFLFAREKHKWQIEVVIEDHEFDKAIDFLIVGFDEVLQFKTKEGYPLIIEYLAELILKKEIIGSAILTENGATIYSSLSKEIYDRSMRELELRYQIKAFDLPEHIYILPNEQIVCEKVINYENFINFILILHFPARTQLGMADYFIESVVEKISKYFMEEPGYLIQ